MIYIDRDREEGGKPIKPPDGWFKRAEDATAAAKADPVNHEIKASVYGSGYVRRALEKLFHEKCAYCETPLVRREWDIDHYRPKKRVHGVPAHPGYYWLGYDWPNLFPSCKFCNQKRKDVATWDDPAEGPGGGKADHFPLSDESQRVDDPNVDTAIEDPLLINPCIDDPSQHLSFSPLGEVIGLDDKGNKSKNLYHLNEKRLRGWRMKRMNAIIDILQLMVEITANPIDKIKMTSILAKDGSEYSAAAGAVIEEPERFGL